MGGGGVRIMIRGPGTGKPWTGDRGQVIAAMKPLGTCGLSRDVAVSERPVYFAGESARSVPLLLNTPTPVGTFK